MTITYKDAQGIQGMRIAGRLTSEVLDYLTPFIKPGITTEDVQREWLKLGDFPGGWGRKTR